MFDADRIVQRLRERDQLGQPERLSCQHLRSKGLFLYVTVVAWSGVKADVGAKDATVYAGDMCCNGGYVSTPGGSFVKVPGDECS